ncbi:Alpha/Beta hydrolase protein [Mycotypha africana]|uniref:Alpha/Beta hydrolase protein n=1 Tax=Mycotypha africana TaxID=64632 RepID=UPI0023003784|nr:Alpha/Beta hydrolase protein [Mycotypha africana]KAI8990773.1 Alpha/Beta hydrolase protein [Mycotypha africana]
MTVKTFSYISSETDNYRSLDLYFSPNANKTSPLVLLVHGGAWRSEDKSDYQELCQGFVHHGLSVASVNYRLSLKEGENDTPHVQHPTHIHDVGNAVKFLYETPPSELYDPKQLYLVGHSAGAHISMMLLLSTDMPYHQYIQGIIGVSGIYDIPLLLEIHPSYADFIVQAFGTDDSVYYDASPINKKSYILGNKPVFILQSSEDTLVDNKQAERMYSHLQTFHKNIELDLTLTGDHYDIMKTENLLKYIKQMLLVNEHT